jgi:transcriptional regulator with XRE-family HTH domain
MARGISSFFCRNLYAIWYSYVEEVAMEFRERLRQLRQRKGLSQNALSKSAGVAQAIVQRLEAGARDVDHLSIGVARRLATALGVSVDYLIGMYEQESPTTTDVLTRHVSPPSQP